MRRCMDNILEVRNLNVYYKSTGRSVFSKPAKKQVLFDISFDVPTIADFQALVSTE